MKIACLKIYRRNLIVSIFQMNYFGQERASVRLPERNHRETVDGSINRLLRVSLPRNGRDETANKSEHRLY